VVLEACSLTDYCRADHLDAFMELGAGVRHGGSEESRGRMTRRAPASGRRAVAVRGAASQGVLVQRKKSVFGGQVENNPVGRKLLRRDPAIHERPSQVHQRTE